ncbi:hypothetical protein AB0E63_19015 [Kribbella sp. NPDC026596]|uniref:hypothetical protein n=1 Tax=Kribbella sp. NPDC026596 TaxID=3155122 RepID=UPI003410D60D
MATPQDVIELKKQIVELQNQLQTITDDDLKAYVKVRDILALGSGLSLGGAEEATGPTAFFGRVVRCAMVGIFEPAVGSGAVGGYDAGAVQRFADLGG